MLKSMIFLAVATLVGCYAAAAAQATDEVPQLEGVVRRRLLIGDLVFPWCPKCKYQRISDPVCPYCVCPNYKKEEFEELGFCMDPKYAPSNCRVCKGTGSRFAENRRRLQMLNRDSPQYKDGTITAKQAEEIARRMRERALLDEEARRHFIEELVLLKTPPKAHTRRRLLVNCPQCKGVGTVPTHKRRLGPNSIVSARKKKCPTCVCPNYNKEKFEELEFCMDPEYSPSPCRLCEGTGNASILLKMKSGRRLAGKSDKDGTITAKQAEEIARRMREQALQDEQALRQHALDALLTFPKAHTRKDRPRPNYSGTQEAL